MENMKKDSNFHKRKELVKRVLVLFMTIVLSATLTNSAVASQPYSIRYAGDNARFGNYCEEILGSGWHCIADVLVTNRSGKMIEPRLVAELVDVKGRKFSARDNSQESTLTGPFNSELNPSETIEWAINFYTGKNVKFKLLNIYEGRKKVATFKYTCSSNWSAFSC